MPNSVKYKTGNLTGSISTGNVALGVNESVLGPTETTGWYNGLTPSPSQYVIYEVNSGSVPKIYQPSDDTQLIQFARSNGATGANTGSVASVLNWATSQADIMIVNNAYPSIVTDGLVLNVDAGFVPSYPTTGSTWYDTSIRVNNSTLVNGVSYIPSSQVMSFDGTDDYVNIPHSEILTNEIFSQTRFSTLESTVKVAVFQNWTCMINKAFGASYSNTTGPGLWSNIDGYEFVIGTGVSSNPSGGSRILRFTALTNRWYHIVGTINGTDMRMYVNGNLHSAVTTNINTIQSNSSPVVIGRRSVGSNPSLNGAISNARIYNKPLTQQEILQNYYQAPIVTDGLVLAVDAGNLVSYESGSTTTYSLTGSLSGSLVNDVEYSSGNGGGWVFDSTDDYIDLPNSLGYSTTTLSVFTWYKSNGQPTGDYHIICGGQECEISIPWPSGALRTGIFTDVRYVSNHGSGLNDGKWHYVGFTFNGSTKTSYIDGINVGTQSITTGTLITSFTNRRLGRYGSSGTYYANGNMGGYWVYNKTLSPEEISQNFNAQRSRFGI
jgi:hypothetical protein